MIVRSLALAMFVLDASAFAIPPLVGDFDADGDVDNADLAMVAGDPLGSSFEFADAVANFGTNVLPDGEGGEYFGAITIDPDPARLLYNFGSGEVLLEQTNAPGGVISTFILISDSKSFVPLADPNYLPFGFSLGANEIGQISNSDPSSFDPSSGFPTNPFSLGPVLPAGLDSVALSSHLTQAVYVGLTGTGVREFALVIVPEPTTYVLVLGSFLLPFRLRR